MEIFKNGSVKNFFLNGGLVLSCCILTVIMLPVYIHYLPVIMILWALSWIYENRSGYSGEMFKNNKAATLFLLFIALYVWQIFGLLLADSLNTGFERLFKRLSFIVFPLVLFYPGETIKKNIDLVLRLFALGTLFYLFICYGNALHHSLFFEDHKWAFRPHPVDYDYENYFYGMRFSSPVHPSYLAMYVVISILIFFETFFDKSITLLRKSIFSLSIIVLLISLYQLSARAGFLAAIIVFPLYFLIKLYNRYSRWAVLTIIIIMALLFTFLAVKNSRVSNLISTVSDQKIEDGIRKDPRLLIWQSAFGVIKDNPILGVGTGDASSKLKEEFALRGYLEGYYDNLNAHNQFLEIWLENGIIGLILFLCILGYIIHLAIKQKNILLGMFIITTIIFFIFETMMNRLAGISFFALFSFLFIYSKSPTVQK